MIFNVPNKEAHCNESKSCTFEFFSFSSVKNMTICFFCTIYYIYFDNSLSKLYGRLSKSIFLKILRAHDTPTHMSSSQVFRHRIHFWLYLPGKRWFTHFTTNPKLHLTSSYNGDSDQVISHTFTSARRRAHMSTFSGDMLEEMVVKPTISVDFTPHAVSRTSY